MKNVIAAVATFGGLTAATLGLADVASAAPTGDSQVEQTVRPELGHFGQLSRVAGC